MICSMRAFVILPAYNTELDLLCKQILNWEIKGRRLIALEKYQCISDIPKTRMGTRPMPMVCSGNQTRLIPVSPINSWKVSPSWELYPDKDRMAAHLGLCWRRPNRAAVFKHCLRWFCARYGNCVESHFHITMNSLWNKKCLQTSTSFKTFVELGWKPKRKGFAWNGVHEYRKREVDMLLLFFSAMDLWKLVASTVLLGSHSRGTETRSHPKLVKIWHGNRRGDKWLQRKENRFIWCISKEENWSKT